MDIIISYSQQNPGRSMDFKVPLPLPVMGILFSRRQILSGSGSTSRTVFLIATSFFWAGHDGSYAGRFDSILQLEQAAANGSVSLQILADLKAVTACETHVHAL